MNWDLVKVLNLVGIGLEFLSFCFAAPEILGEKRLRALERGVEQGIRVLPGTLAILAGMVISLAVFWVLPGLDYARTRPPPGERTVWRTLLAMLRGFGGVAVGMLVGLPVGVVLGVLLEDIVVKPLLQRLANDARVRQRSLVVGAVLFMVAFLCQFTAALLDIW